MAEWQQIKTDLETGIMPDINTLKTSVDDLLTDLDEISKQLDQLTVIINSAGGDNVIPILPDYIALAVLSKYGNEVIFAIAAFGYFPRIWLNCCCICSNV